MSVNIDTNDGVIPPEIVGMKVCDGGFVAAVIDTLYRTIDDWEFIPHKDADSGGVGNFPRIRNKSGVELSIITPYMAPQSMSPDDYKPVAAILRPAWIPMSQSDMNKLGESVLYVSKYLLLKAMKAGIAKGDVNIDKNTETKTG